MESCNGFIYVFTFLRNDSSLPRPPSEKVGWRQPQVADKRVAKRTPDCMSKPWTFQLQVDGQITHSGKFLLNPGDTVINLPTLLNSKLTTLCL